jgi:hypothetical protein
MLSWGQRSGSSIDISKSILKTNLLVFFTAEIFFYEKTRNRLKRLETAKPFWAYFEIFSRRISRALGSGDLGSRALGLLCSWAPGIVNSRALGLLGSGLSVHFSHFWKNCFQFRFASLCDSHSHSVRPHYIGYISLASNFFAWGARACTTGSAPTFRMFVVMETAIHFLGNSNLL